MSRSIAESITALENARNDIVDALNSKIEGGGIEKTLKISEVAEKINSIEVGGGSSGLKLNNLQIGPFENIESTKIIFIDSNTFKIVVNMPSGQQKPLYLCNAKSLNGALNKITDYQYETNEFDIDTFCNSVAQYALIHASQYYDVMEDTRTAPYVMIFPNSRE